jgi:hypothetical protein
VNTPVAPNFPTLYQFSAIEFAIQNLAQVAQLVWLTSKERATQLQSARPRVDALLTHINPFGDPPHYVYTKVDGARRINGWLASLILTLVTDSDYDNHIIWRASVQNFMATIDTALGDFQNLALLPYHTIARCWDKNNTAEITPQKGYFESKLEYGITFGIYPDAWPVGLLTA